MSITAVGQVGYSYQDDVTVWLVLTYRATRELHAVADSGQEDATFSFVIGGNKYALEVQMKTERGPLDEALLATWLAHFPARKSTGSLLEQLQNRSNLNVLFVATATCTTGVASLCITDATEAQRPRAANPNRLTQTHASAILQAFASAHNCRQPSQLEAQRAHSCEQIAARITEHQFCEIARRIFVISVDQHFVRTKAARILNTEFHVPQGTTNDGLDDLAQLVRFENSSGRDIVAPLINKAVGFGRALLLTPGRPHVTRVEEAPFFDELEKHHALLLTGLPYAGKTHTARALASRYQLNAFFAEENADTGKAARFLRAANSEERIFLLDDPFGALTPVQDARQKLKAVCDLLSDVSVHRKLIVTSRANILHELLGEPPWQLDGYPFHDISLSSATLAESIWSAHAINFRTSPQLDARISALLHNQPPNELLQPGQLRYLARNIPNEATDDGLLQIARQDARELGQILCENVAMRAVLASLRLLASTALPAHTQELFFVLSDIRQFPPGTSLCCRFRTIGWSTKTIDAPTFPVYGMQYTGTREQQEALDTIERRGLVERTEEGYRFTHPNYLLAAEQALCGAGGNHFQRLLDWNYKALFCLRPRNASNAVSALTALFNSAHTNNERSDVLLIAFSAYDSSPFPAVRDRCLVWLLRNRAALNKEQNNSLLHAFRHDEADAHRIVWQNGEAWFDPRDDISFYDTYVATSITHQFNEAPIDTDALTDEQQLGARLPPEKIWTLLHQQRNPVVAPYVLRNAFQYDETFVRIRAAELALKYHPNDASLIELILSDDHPLVYAAGLKGLLSVWNTQDSRSDTERLERFLTAGMTSERATTVLVLLERFESVGGWYNQTSPPAEPWALLTATALRAVSEVDRIDAVHLHHYALRLLPLARTPQAIDVLWAWTEWVERAVRSTQLDDFACSIGHLWLLVTTSNAHRRPGVVQRLVAQKDTRLFVTIIADLVNDWTLLDIRERELVLHAVDADRPDSRWARALVLACRNPPTEIVTRLLGSSEAYEAMLCRRLEPIDRRVLDDCLRTCEEFGGITEGFKDFIVKLSSEPEHPLFARAIRYCLNGNTGTLRFEDWTSSVWRNLCRGADDARREILFHQLLDTTIEHNSNHWQPLWRELLDATPSADELENWLEKLDYFVETIDNFDNICFFLHEPRIGEKLTKRLIRDYAWLKRHRLARSDVEIRALVFELYSNGAPRLRLVHSHVMERLRAGNAVNESCDSVSDSLAAQVEKARKAGSDLGHSRRDEASNAKHRPLDDWTWLCDTIVLDDPNAHNVDATY